MIGDSDPQMNSSAWWLPVMLAYLLKMVLLPGSFRCGSSAIMPSRRASRNSSYMALKSSSNAGLLERRALEAFAGSP